MKREEYEIKRKVIVEPEMFYSEAFQSLSKSALITLMRCLQKRTWKKGKVGGKKRTVYTDDPFKFSYEEAAELLGIGTTQHWKNMTLLIEVGFIDLVHQGGWYQKYESQRDYSLYKYSDRWRRFGTAEFEKVKKQRSLLPGFDIRSNLERQKTKATSQKRRCHLHKSEGEDAKQAASRLHESEGGA
jgi:hypothetical protein